MAAPMMVEITVASRPTVSEMRVLQIHSASTDWPSSVVPNHL